MRRHDERHSHHARRMSEAADGQGRGAHGSRSRGRVGSRYADGANSAGFDGRADGRPARTASNSYTRRSRGQSRSGESARSGRYGRAAASAEAGRADGRSHAHRARNRRSGRERGEGSQAAYASARGGRPTARASQKRKRAGKLKVAIIAAVVAVLVGAGSAFAYYQVVNGNLHAGVDSDLRGQLVKTDLTKEPFYMLLMGTDASSERESDESYGGSFRTDSIMLARIDPVEKKASLVSIHRDTLVDLGEYGMQKLNSAHAFGGAALSVKAVSDMAGVGISHYAEINFDGFKDIVDSLGGIEVDVPVQIDDEDAGGHLDAGLQTLNGDQALILCRSRNTYFDYADPDSMRAANQRLVLSAIAKKILDSDVATIANSVNAISRYVTTDLDVSDIIGLAQAMQGLDPDSDIYTAMEPVTAEYDEDSGMWYTVTNESEWRTMIARMNQGLPPTENASVDEKTGTVMATAGADAVDTSTKTAAVTVRNGTDRSGLAAQAADKLAAVGFANVSAGNANATDYAKTVVIYEDANHAYEASQIVSALGCGTAQQNDGNYLYDGDFLVIIGADWPDSAGSGAGASAANGSSAGSGSGDSGGATASGASSASSRNTRIRQ